MFNATSGPTSEPRVIYHPHCCPTCESANVAVGDIDTGDGLTETALICLDCGDAWPLACVAEWGGPSDRPTWPPPPAQAVSSR